MAALDESDLLTVSQFGAGRGLLVPMGDRLIPSSIIDPGWHSDRIQHSSNTSCLPSRPARNRRPTETRLAVGRAIQDSQPGQGVSDGFQGDDH
jgi:hypothetical protein